jgi:hypothetical protein
MTKVIVFHTGYGCWTGCCGHAIAVVDENGNEKRQAFEFAHPYFKGERTEEEAKKWAQQLVANEMGSAHVADLDWEHCIIEDDVY